MNGQWQVGQVILGEYAIEKELGRGGMGRVWLVKSNSTGRQFAVKQALVHGVEQRKAFLAELQTWIDLPEHPNILPCRFFRTVGDEIVIFTDYIDGGSLADWVASRKLSSVEQILDVAIQFAWGLHAIHERGLIHQDVKPGNVLMTSAGVPLVADFGLARARLRGEESGFDSPALSDGNHSILVPGAGLMTKAYASPEQRADQPLSRKTDIWSWGVSVLDMFMGGVSCPHGGQIAAEVLESFIENSVTDADLLRIPAEVARTLVKCFDQDPSKRWESVDKASQALVDAFGNKAGHYDGREKLRSVITTQQIKAHKLRKFNGAWRDSQIWLRWASMVAGFELDKSIQCQLISAYSRKGADVADLVIYEEAERLFTKSIANGCSRTTGLLACFYMHKADIYASLKDFAGALKAYDQSISIFKHLIATDSRHEFFYLWFLAGVLACKASLIKSMGDLYGALSLYDESITIHQRLMDQEINGDMPDARMIYDENIMIYQQLVDPDGKWDLPCDLAMVFMNKGTTVQSIGDLAGAIGLFSQSIEIYQRLQENGPRVDLDDKLATSLLNKAGALYEMGEGSFALEIYDKCIVTYRRLVEEAGWAGYAGDLAFSLMNKGSVIRKTDYKTAVLLYDESIAIYKRLVEQLGRDDLVDTYIDALMNRAVIENDIQKASEYYDQCIEFYRRLVIQDGRRELTPKLAQAFLCKGRSFGLDGICWGDTGELTIAAELLGESSALYKRLVEQEGRWDLAVYFADVLLHRANVISAMSDFAGAVEVYGDCIAIYRRLVVEEGKWGLGGHLAEALMNKSSSLRDMGEPSGAMILSNEAIAIYKKLIEQASSANYPKDPVCSVWFAPAREKYGPGDYLKNLAAALDEKALMVHNMGDLFEALALYREAIAIYKQLVERDGDNELGEALAATYMNMAITTKVMGDLPSALQLYEESVVIYKRLLESGWHYGAEEQSDDLEKVLKSKAFVEKAIKDVAKYDQHIAANRSLVEGGGRWDLANELARAYMNKALTIKAVGDLGGAVKICEECMLTIKRLVQHAKRSDLFCDENVSIFQRVVNQEKCGFIKGLAVCELIRSHCLVLQKENMSEQNLVRARVAFDAISGEFQKTGAGDLSKILVWAQKSLKNIVS